MAACHAAATLQLMVLRCRSHILPALHFLLFLADLNLNLEDVVLEISLLLGTIWEDHLSISVLDASDPFSLVTATVGPIHFTVAIPFVFFVLAFVNVPTGPLEHSIAVFSIT